MAQNNIRFALGSPLTSSLSFSSGGGPFRLRTKQWPSWFVYMDETAVPVGNVRGHGGPAGDAGEFIFTRIYNSEFYLISQKRWENWYIYMQANDTGNVRSWEGDPGSQGHWKIKPRGDGSFLLTTEAWPEWYMYMEDNPTGNVRGWEGDPGPKGHFMLACDVRMTN